MEQGVAVWRRPWRSDSGAHVNLLSGRAYRGSNPVLLTLGLHLRGSNLPYWCGWGEAQRLGLAPRRGSRGVMILRPVGAGPTPPPAMGDGPSLEEREAEGLPATAPAPRRRCGFRSVVVFNAADLIGDATATRGLAERIARCRAGAAERSHAPDERLAFAERRLSAWPVALLEGCSMACYRPELDTIELPSKERFESASSRLATWAHEAIHSTGHSTRLARDLGGAFGSNAYAREELVAELGAVLLGERLQIGSDTANHAAYLSHWCALLREDPRQLLRVLA